MRKAKKNQNVLHIFKDQLETNETKTLVDHIEIRNINSVNYNFAYYQ